MVPSVNTEHDYRFHSETIRNKYTNMTASQLEEVVEEMTLWFDDAGINYRVEQDKESDWLDDCYLVLDNAEDAMHFKLRWL